MSGWGSGQWGGGTAVPALFPGEYEITYNGLTFGGSRTIGITQIDGLDSVPMRQDDVTIPGAHGSYIRAQFGEARRIVIEGDIAVSADNLEASMEALRAAFRPQTTPLPLSYQLHGSTKKRVNCVRTRFAFSIDNNYQIGYPQWVAEFLAGDPRIYEDLLNTYAVDPAPTSGIGVVMPIDFSFTYGGGASGSLSVTNVGIAPTFGTARINGPAVNPQLWNITTGQFLKFGLTLATGEYLIIDFGAKTVLLNGTASRYSTLDPLSTWWALDPGTSNIQFIADGTVGGTTTMTFSYRSAWL